VEDPLVKKSVCPKEHEEEARAFIESCQTFLAVGFSARDDDVLELLQGMPNSSRLIVVGNGDAAAIAGRSAGRNDCICRAGETFPRQSGRNSLGVEFRAVEGGWQHHEIVGTKREETEQAHPGPETQAWEWKAQISLRVRQDLRREMEEFADKGTTHWHWRRDTHSQKVRVRELLQTVAPAETISISAATFWRNDCWDACSASCFGQR
jgi:hypothetical protein